jgi:hypothetical protein
MEPVFAAKPPKDWESTKTLAPAAVPGGWSWMLDYLLLLYRGNQIAKVVPFPSWELTSILPP